MVFHPKPLVKTIPFAHLAHLVLGRYGGAHVVNRRWRAVGRLAHGGTSLARTHLCSAPHHMHSTAFAILSTPTSRTRASAVFSFRVRIVRFARLTGRRCHWQSMGADLCFLAGRHQQCFCVLLRQPACKTQPTAPNNTPRHHLRTRCTALSAPHRPRRENHQYPQNCDKHWQTECRPLYPPA